VNIPFPSQHHFFSKSFPGLRRSLLLACVLVACAPALQAAVIHWGGGARNILADTDASTEGILVRALAKSGAASSVVNGITFGPFPGPDTLSGQIGTIHSTGALPVAGGISPAYATLLSQNERSSTATANTLTLTLNNLLPGHHYQLQLWFHDANTSGLDTLRVKSSGSLDPWVVLDANTTNSAGGRGQHAIGTFTADATTQVVQLIGTPFAALQAYQLRLISAPLAPVTWDNWRPTTGPADVASEGEPFRAYAFGAIAPATPLNGTAFTRFLSQSTDTLSGFSSVGTDSFGSASAPFADLPADYRILLAGGASGGRAGSLTLNNLQPGQWYYVQVWANDSRAAAGGRRQRINNSLFHNINPGGPADDLAYEGGLGHWLQGRFQAITSSHRLDFVSDTSIQLNALQLRAITAPDPSLANFRYRRLFSLHAYRDGVFTNSNPWVGVQALFALGDFPRARSELSRLAANYASSSLVPTHSFHLWPAVDLYIRRSAFIDQLSRERMISTLRKFDYRGWSNTSNLSKLAWTMRTLGSQEFGESSFIFPDNAWRDADPRGYGPLLARLETEARNGTGEYASAPYGWYNVMPSLSLAQLSTDPALAARARVAFDAHLAQLAAQWMPGGYLATWSGRTYPLAGGAMSMGRLLWFWFGDGGRSGEAQEILMPASMDYEPPIALLRAATERSTIYTARHRADAFQTAYVYKDQFGFFSHDGSGGGDQQVPDGLRWRGMSGNYLYITRPAVDTPEQVRASNAPGNANADYSTLQHLDTQLMVFDLSYRAQSVPYAIGYVPGTFTAMINLTGNATLADGRSRIFLNYDRVMVAITSDVRFDWDPASGIYCPWPGVRTDPTDRPDSEFRIAVGGVGHPRQDPTGFTSAIDHTNNRFAVAIEVAHPEEYPGSTPAEKLAAFRDAILSNTTLSRDSVASPTTARYTTRRGDRLRVTSKSGTVSTSNPRPAFINDVALNYDNTRPMLANPWMSQAARGSDITLTGGGTRNVYNLTNWTRTDSVLADTTPLPSLAAGPALGLAPDAATAVGQLSHPGTSASTLTLFWGPSDAGTTNPAAWPNSVALGSFPAAAPLFGQLSGLSPNTQYTYRFRAENASGTVWSSAVTFRTPALASPDVPRALRFTLTSGSIPLAWDPVPGASGYVVRRATVSGGPYTDLATGLSSPAFTDTTVSPGTTYFYVVAALGPGGASGNSGQLTATPAVLPTVPAGLSVTTAYRYAFLTWNAVPWAATYTVKRGTSSSGPFTTIASGLTDTFFEDTSSVHGVRYHYVVSATNLVGESANSVHFSHTVNVTSWITESSGPWTTATWFPPARGQPVSANTTIVDFDNQSAALASNLDRGAFTLNQLRFRGQNVALTGDAISFAGTTPRVSVATNSTSTVANTLALSDATTFEIAGNLTVTAPLSGSAALTKSGNGTLTLAQTNPAHTGGLTLGGGRLALSAAQPGLRGLTFGSTASSTIGSTLDLGHDVTVTSLLVQTTGPTNRLLTSLGRIFTVAGPHTQGGIHNGVSSAHLAVSGGGTFFFNQPAGDFVVRRASTLDFSDAGAVNITAARVLVGDLDNNTGSQPSTFIVSAAGDTTLRTDRLALSSVSTTGNSVRGESTALLAPGGTGRFILRNTAGTGPAVFEIDRNTGSASSSSSFLVDLRGQHADLWISDLSIGARSQTNSAGSSGSFFFDTGLIRVDGLTRLAVAEGGKSKNVAVLQIDGGQVHLAGGVLMASTVSGENNIADFLINGGNVVSGPISLATANPGYTLGTLSVAGGSLTLTGPITRGPITGIAAGNYASDGSARLVLEGGTLDLGGQAIGSAEFPIHTVSLQEGTLRNVASINGSSGLTKNSPGTLVLGGMNKWTGATSILADTVDVEGTLDSPGTLTIGASAVLTGSGTLRAPVVIGGTIDPSASLRLERSVRFEPGASFTFMIDRAMPFVPIFSGATTLTYGGSLRLQNTGAPLEAGDRFTLFHASSYNGAFPALELPPLAPGLAWDTRDLYSSGTVIVLTAAELAESLARTSKYWDGSTAPGLQPANGVWDVTSGSSWSTQPEGSSLPNRFWTSDSVYFQNGGTNLVTLNGTALVSVLAQSVNGTATTLTGGALLLGGPNSLSNGAPSGNQPLILDTAVALNGINTTIHAAQAITFVRGLAGSGNITKTGSGLMTLGGDIPWTGGLFLGGGTVRIGGEIKGLTALWFGPTTGSLGGSTLELSSDVTLAATTFKLQSIGSNHIALPAGRTLTLTGEAVLGTNTATLTGVTGNTSLTTSGGGTLFIPTGGKNFTIAGSRTGNAARVDFSGLGRVVIEAGPTGNLFLGVYNSNTSDFLHLAGNATLTAANFYIGDANLGGTHTLRLGTETNILNITNVYVGQKPGANNRSDASFTFGGAGGSLRLRAVDGTSRANVFLNDNNSTTGRTLVNAFDLAGGTADLLLDQLVISRRNASSSPAIVANDLFRWERGTLDVLSPVVLAQAPAAAQKTHTAAMELGSSNSGTSDSTILRGGVVVAQNRSTVTTAGAIAQGNLTIAGGSISSGEIVLGEILTSTAPTTGTRQSHAALTMTGGSLAMTGPIRSGSATGPGTKTATVTLDGGVLNMGGHALGGNGSTALTALNMLSGTLANAGPINGNAGLTKTGNGTLTLTGNHAFTGPLQVTNGTLVLGGDASSSVTVSAGATIISAGKTSGDLTLSAGATFRVRLRSATDFDGITLTGSGSTASLGGTLEIEATPGLAPGTRFRIVRNEGNPSSVVTGFFVGCQHHSPFSAGGRTWYIDYQSGSGGDVDLVLASPRELWSHTHFGTLFSIGAAGSSADPDGDGTPNLVEYALGTLPLSADSRPALSVTLKEADTVRYVEITFLRIADPTIVYRVEATSNLTNDDWTTVWESSGSANTAGPVTVQDTQALAPNASLHRFLRLKVITP